MELWKITQREIEDDLEGPSHRSQNGKWYDEQAHSLGVLFGALFREEENKKKLLEKLNLNFRANGKCEKKKKRWCSVDNKEGDYVRDQ